MIQSPLLPFPVKEYEDRLAKIVAGMDKTGVDAIILTSDENTYYFSGFNSIVWDSKVSTPGTLVITKTFLFNGKTALPADVDEAALNKLAFTLTGPDGFSEEIPYADFTDGRYERGTWCPASIP